MRDTARNWIEMAERVWHYRRDLLSEAEQRELCQHTAELRKLWKEGADSTKLKIAIESLEPVLQRLGGKIYPKTTIIDNVEFFLMAAIVILGIRTYIIQPFKIPTNSMWPSYYGMTAENHPPSEPERGWLERAFRIVAFGATQHAAVAPADGEVVVPLGPSGGLFYRVVKGRNWLVFPAEFKEYTFYVGGREAKIVVPFDFSGVDEVFLSTFFGGVKGFHEHITKEKLAGAIEEKRIEWREGSGQYATAFLLNTRRLVKAGAPVVRFDLLTGDQLFVDRMSYHFVKPSVGDGFVFRTDNIPGIGQEQYYIKRLVGLPGDKLEIREPVLYRNGAPITGAAAFEANAKREGKYRGYLYADFFNWQFLRKDAVMTVPKDGFFALGDNSPDSKDGRDWGHVPMKDAIGRPLFIYYPFTRRWGIAQ